MAEVTGDIGGQSVELNNAATEATLKQLLQATLAMAQKMGVDVKKQADMEKEMKKFFDQLDKTNKGLKDSKKQREDEAKAAAKLAAAKQREAEMAQKAEMVTVGLYRGLNQAAETAMAFATKLTGAMSSFANMGSSFSGAASTFNNIPIVGGMLSSVFGAIAAAAEKLQTSFRTSSSVGANFGGSIREMVRHASMAGLTFEQYGQVIQKNGEGLAFLGGSTTEGAKRLANFSKTLKQTGLQDDLARLGMTSEDIANGMAQVSGRLARSGLTRGMSDAAVAKTTADYLKNLDAVSRLTGKNKDALQAEADARMADSQYRLMLAKLDPDGAANLEALMASIPKEHQAGLKEILATGTAVSDEAQAAMYYLNQTGKNAMQLGQVMRSTGTLTKEQMYSFDEARRAEMRMQAEQAKTGTGMISTVGMFGDAVQQKFTVGILDAAAQTGTLRQTQEQQTQELKNATEAAKNHKDSLDPANMVRMQQEIAKTANEFNVLLANHLPKLQEAFTKLVDFIEKYVVPIFEFFMDHIKEITIAIASVVVGLTVLGKVMQAYKAYQEFKALGKERGATPANPMFTKDIGGAAPGGGVDVDGPDGKKGGKTGRGRAGRNVVRGLGVAGTVISAGMLYSDISDINEREQSGQITAEQASIEKGGATGSALGGAGGAWAGAAAGAAVGSVVPVIGTVIGGAIGAALGGWLGSKGGEIAGEKLAQATAKPGPGTPEWMKVNDKNIQSWTDAVAKGTHKFEQVPDIYKPYVQDRLNKLPKKTTPATPAAPTTKPPEKTGANTAASTTPNSPPTSGINYNAKPEDLLKQFAKSQGVVGTPKEIKTTTGSVETMTHQMKADADKKAAAQAEAEAKAKEEADKKAKAEAARTAGQPGQDTSATAISSLNTTMVQLLKTNKDLLAVSERQLAIQRQITGDVFTI